MAQRGRPPLARGVFAFDAPDWEPPKAVVLDTNVVAEALLPNEQEHQPCVALLERLADTGTAVVFSRLLEVELWEAVFNLALRERHPRKNLRYVRYDNRVRPRAARLLQTRFSADRAGRAPYLERVVTANLSKISTAMRCLRIWARRRGLKPSETAYVARSRGRAQLRFSKSGEPSIERAYRTHWVSPGLSERKRERLAERQGKPPELVVISPIRDWTCAACEGTGGLLIMEGPGPLCLACAEMDHLVFLAAGDAALTRRAKAASTLSAVVVRFSRARKRYQRQGIMVEEDALAGAERQCLVDEDARSRRRERDRLRRADEDADLVTRFAAQIKEQYPGCPSPRAQAIAHRAAARGSGRVGRTAAGQALQVEAVELAVIASIRHEDTDYDELLMAGVDRAEARERVRNDVERALKAWRADAAVRG